jgi:hypothetical protein
MLGSVLSDPPALVGGVAGFPPSPWAGFPPVAADTVPADGVVELEVSVDCLLFEPHPALSHSATPAANVYLTARVMLHLFVLVPSDRELTYLAK